MIGLKLTAFEKSLRGDPHFCCLTVKNESGRNSQKMQRIPSCEEAIFKDSFVIGL